MIDLFSEELDMEIMNGTYAKMIGKLEKSENADSNNNEIPYT